MFLTIQTFFYNITCKYSYMYVRVHYQSAISTAAAFGVKGRLSNYKIKQVFVQTRLDYYLFVKNCFDKISIFDTKLIVKCDGVKYIFKYYTTLFKWGFRLQIEFLFGKSPIIHFRKKKKLFKYSLELTWRAKVHIVDFKTKINY